MAETSNQYESLKMLNIIQKIKGTSSKLEKISLLSNELHNEDFKTVLKMTYSPVFNLSN